MLNTMHSPNNVPVQKAKVKISPLTCHEDLEVEYRKSGVNVS